MDAGKRAYMKVYGLRNCDTCRKARKELDATKVAYDFHDVRDEGVTKTQVARWARKAGWETLLNKSSTTWRGLPDAEKSGVTEAKAIAQRRKRGGTAVAVPLAACGEKPQTAVEALEYIATKIGIVLLVLGCMHFFNVFNFAKMRGKALRHAKP